MKLLFERMLGSLGVLLLGLLAWSCTPQTGNPHTLRQRARRAIAWLVVEGVTVIGWTIDHLAPGSASPQHTFAASLDAATDRRSS